MNVAYDQISCADAARMTGIEYTFLTKLCKERRINCTNISGGDKKGRYVLGEDEVNYIKTLKQKFGRNYMQKYRKDWARGKQPAQTIETPVVQESEAAKNNPAPVINEPKPVIATIESMVTGVSKEEPVNKRVDIDEIAIKIGYIQDIKDKLENLEAQKNQLLSELEDLRKEVMEYL